MQYIHGLICDPSNNTMLVFYINNSIRYLGSEKRPQASEMDADLRIGRRLETGRPSESYMHIYNQIYEETKVIHCLC
jgi:hypothetical protein